MIRRSIVFLLVGLVATQWCSQSALAFSATGHKVIASICFQQLTPDQQSEVIKILKRHPRFRSDFRDKMPSEIRDGSEEMQAEWLFQQAAVWPDMVRGGSAHRKSFHRARWHFVNVPHFLTDADREELEDDIDVNLGMEPPGDDFDDTRMNIVQAIKNSTRILRADDQAASLKAVHICWILHCVGDLAQPLHSTALFSRNVFPNGDRGGNRIRTRQLSNLHSAWDRSFGSDSSFRTSRRIAIQLLADQSAASLIQSALADRSPESWLEQSNEIAVEHAYDREVTAFLKALEENDDDPDHNSLPLTDEYLSKRRKIADQQVVLAGVRAATVLVSGDGQEGLALRAAAMRPAGLRAMRSVDSRIEKLEDLGGVEFAGDIKESEDISAIAVFDDGEYLIIGADEGVEIQVLKKSGDNKYKVEQTISLVDFETEDEIDIEGIAVDGKTVHVIGSHSRKRSTVKSDKSQKKNRERLTENELQPLREGIYRFTLNSDGELDSEINSTSLRRRFDLDPVLRAFANIPSKENGVDIEGIAAHEDKLYAAFRGPVLRGGYVPILEFEFDEPHKAETLYVNLGGRGIRDIVRVKKGFLLIGGPVGDASVSYELYFWDGEDGVPGTDASDVEPLKSLGEIPLPKGSKAEGVTVLKEDDSEYEVLIVYDSAANGAATRFRVEKNN